MKAKDLRERSTEDLAELEKSIAAERFQSKFKNFTNRLDDTSLIRKAKRALARVKLILGERARGAAVAAPSEAAPVKAKAAPAAEAKAAEAPVAAPAKPKAAAKKIKAEAAPESEAAATTPKPAAKKAKPKSTEQGESK